MSEPAIVLVIVLGTKGSKSLQYGGLVSDSNKETESGSVIVEYTYLSPPNEAHMLFPVSDLILVIYQLMMLWFCGLIKSISSTHDLEWFIYEKLLQVYNLFITVLLVFSYIWHSIYLGYRWRCEFVCPDKWLPVWPIKCDHVFRASFHCGPSGFQCHMAAELFFPG